MWKRSSKRKGRKRKPQPQWYRLRPVTLLFALAAFAGLSLTFLARGQWGGFANVVTYTGFAIAGSAGAAFTGAWVTWRLTRRSDAVANIAFALIVLAAGAWTLGLSGTERMQVEQKVRQTLGGRVAVLKQHAHAAIGE